MISILFGPALIGHALLILFLTTVVIVRDVLVIVVLLYCSWFLYSGRPGVVLLVATVSSVGP